MSLSILNFENFWTLEMVFLIFKVLNELTALPLGVFIQLNAALLEK